MRHWLSDAGTCNRFLETLGCIVWLQFERVVYKMFIVELLALCACILCMSNCKHSGWAGGNSNPYLLTIVYAPVHTRTLQSSNNTTQTKHRRTTQNNARTRTPSSHSAIQQRPPYHSIWQIQTRPYNSNRLLHPREPDRSRHNQQHMSIHSNSAKHSKTRGRKGLPLPRCITCESARHLWIVPGSQTWYNDAHCLAKQLTELNITALCIWCIAKQRLFQNCTISSRGAKPITLCIWCRLPC